LINRYINYLIVAYAFVIPISRAGIVFVSSLLILLFIIDNYNNIKEKFIKILKNKIILFFILFFIYSFISILWSDNIYEAFRYAKKYWYFLSIIPIYVYIKKEYIEYSITAFLFAMLISEIISYGIFFEFWTFKHGTPNDPSPFMNHLQYSMFLAFTALLLLNRVFNIDNIKYKIGYFIYFLTVTINLFINGGRTGQVAFVISIFIVGFLNIKNKLKALVIIFLLISSILTIGYNYSNNFKYRVDAMKSNIENVINNNNFSTSVGARIGFYLVGYEIIKDNFFFGVGISDVMSNINIYSNNLSYDLEFVKSLPNVHNDFLQIFIGLGIFGSILYILIFYKILKININDKRYKNLPIIFVSVYMISSMFENMFHQQFSMAILALFVGLFLAKSRIEIEKNEI
jgi:O-antigen ligase